MKHRIALALFATACMAGMSFAADLPVSAPYQPFIVRQPVEWTGLYFGANAGYGWGQYSSNITFAGLTVVNAADLTAAGGATELSRTRVTGSGSPSGAIAGGPDRIQLAGRNVRVRRGDRRPVVRAGEHLHGRLRA